MAAVEDHGPNVLLHLALGMWGLCSWILFNGLWGQIPLFVRTLPEGNKLGVLMLTAEQLAYIFPLAFMYKRRPSNYPRSSQELDIWVLLISGFLISFLLSQYWDFQAPIFGVNHSVGLLALAFLTGAVCSSTGIVFTPYLASLPKTYTSAHTAGAGLSGLFVAVLSLIADSGAVHPRLSVSTYFQILSFIFLLSIISFTYVRGMIGDLNQRGYHPVANVEEGRGSIHAHAAAPPTTTAANERSNLAAHKPTHSPPVSSNSPHYQTQTVGEASEEGYGSIEEGGGGAAAAEDPRRTTCTSGSNRASSLLWPILSLLCFLAALAYGIVPSVLPLATFGYTDSSRVLMASTVGFMIADPLGKLATSFVHTGRIFLSGFITIIFAGVLLYCAIQSSVPPLSQFPLGGMLPVLANTFFSFAFSFTSLSIFFNQRNKEPGEAYRFYSWVGFSIQTGAFVGTGITLFFILLLTK